jgi:hypothetical protein
MAARQDQTLVIVNIVCILLFLLCAVLAYVGFKGRSDARQELANTQKSLQDATAATRNMQTENEDLRGKIGVGAQDRPDAVLAAFEADMKLYNPGAGEVASYRNALTNIHRQAKTAEASEAQSKQKEVEIQARLEALENQTNAAMAAVEAERKKAVDGAAAALAQFNADRAQLEQVKENLRLTVERQSGTFGEQLAARDAQIKQLSDQIAKMELTIKGYQDRLKPATFSFEVADGNISYVSQGGVVWIDLGSADALRPLVTFSVFDADVTDTAKTAPKGTIEVTSIMADHQSEARVTSDDPRNPILRGDKIYSPAWQRGKQLHFALTGIIDVNEDGQSDLQLVRNLVQLNDGVVDSYLGDDGTVEGALTVNTRYLVLGKLPEGVLRQKNLEGWTVMNKEAVTLGVETITLDQFLDQMGYRPDSRAVQLGATATARQFPARSSAESAAAGAEAMPSRFRPRNPPSSMPNSTPTTTPPASIPR